MTTEVFIVRHGETMFNYLNKVQGWSDSPLTQKGIDDLVYTAKKLANVHFDGMFSSDLKRSIDTVHLFKDINRVSQIGKIEKLPAFREVFFGSFEGDDVDETWLRIAHQAGLGDERVVERIIDQVGLAKFRDLTKETDPRHLAEDSGDLDGRIALAIDELSQKTAGLKRVLLVSHGDFIKSLAVKFWHAGLGDAVPFPDNGSVSRAVIENGRFEIIDYDIEKEDLGNL